MSNESNNSNNQNSNNNSPNINRKNSSDSNNSIKKKLSLKYSNLNLKNFEDFDYIINYYYNYINDSESNLKEYKLTENDLKMINKIKYNVVQNRHFKKWYIMSYSSEQIKYFSKFNNDGLYNYYKKINDNNYINENKNLTISQSEEGLKYYYKFRKKHFKSRVFKGPPEPFRIISYFIVSNIKIRYSFFYEEILKNDLDEKIDNQIKKDLDRSMIEIETISNYTLTMQNNLKTCENNNEMFDEEEKYLEKFDYDIDDIYLKYCKNPLYNILKVIALIDKELSYCQGMNFIISFLLYITKGNEIDSFYLIINLLSKTFNRKFGIRGFFTEGFPKLNFFLYIFDKNLKKKLPKIYDLIYIKLEYPKECWIGKWIQTLFVHILPKDKLIRLFDAFFSYNIKFIISFSLGLLHVLENKINNILDVNDLCNLFKSLKSNKGFENRLKLNIDEILKISKDKYFFTNKDMYEYITEYINENKITKKVSVFDDIKYDLNILNNYKIGSEYDFINNNLNNNVEDENEEIDIESIVKQLKPCKKINKENISDDETNLMESGKNFHKIPYSSKNNSISHIKNPFIENH